MTDFSHFTSAAIVHRTAPNGTKLQAVQAGHRSWTLLRTLALASLLPFLAALGLTYSVFGKRRRRGATRNPRPRGDGRMLLDFELATPGM